MLKRNKMILVRSRSDLRVTLRDGHGGPLRTITRAEWTPFYSLDESSPLLRDDDLEVRVEYADQAAAAVSTLASVKGKGR